MRRTSFFQGNFSQRLTQQEQSISLFRADSDVGDSIILIAFNCGRQAGQIQFVQHHQLAHLAGTNFPQHLVDFGDLFGGLFGRGAQPRTSRPRRGKDLETETQLDFLEATKGVAMPLRLTSPAPCTNCHGSGARPGTSPKVCASCNGSGVVNRNQGAFGFSEPCTDCRGSGSVIENPCDDCRGTGVTTRSRTINVRIPPGVEDGQRIRLAGQGEAGLRGAPSGDLYVTVHVRPDKVFGRDGNDLTVAVPVSFTELALGTTLSVPTLDGKVGVKVPKGTADGRILRVRGRGVPKRDGGAGDLLVTVKVAVPPQLEGAALEALLVDDWGGPLLDRAPRLGGNL